MKGRTGGALIFSPDYLVEYVIVLKRRRGEALDATAHGVSEQVIVLQHPASRWRAATYFRQDEVKASHEG
jgi:hypothetical protein